MISRRIARAAFAPHHVMGDVLARDLRDPDGRIAIAKGSVLDAEGVATLATLPWDELHLVVPEPDEVHERLAGERLARAAAGAGVEVGALNGGHWPLTAMHRGILDVRVEALRAVNAVEGLCVYTLYDTQVVDRGEGVARAKIVPFVLPEATLAHGEATARAAGGVVRVRPFLPLRVAAVVQESLGGRAMARFEQALGEKVEWFESRLLPIAFVAAEVEAVARGVQAVLAAGADVVTLAGSRPMDPLDPAFGALESIGATIVRRGVPAHPGSLCWLARAGAVPIVGMPSCGLFSQATVFDLVLPRLLAGDRLDAGELAGLGHGGFLTRDMAFRFPPYRQTRERGAVE